MSPLPPCAENRFHADHVAKLLASLRQWTGRDLVDANLSSEEQARRIFDAPFALLSHDISADPLLNYGNHIGMELFELSWDQLLRTPSRLTAEALAREERARLLDAVTRRGYIDDYRGVRISKHGRRFEIERATVWNVLDDSGRYCGQAATFSQWRFLDDDERTA